MSRKHEVEYRALITEELFRIMLEHGRKECSESFEGPLTIEDAYFCPRPVRDFREIEMNEVGSYSLRLRREVSDGKSSASLNTKVIRTNGDHNAWLEHEVSISSYEEGGLILESIGFKKFFELRKNRYSFSDTGVNVYLEEIDNFQPVIELEILTSEDKTKEAKETLLNYFAAHGISKDMIVQKSITNLLMKERASF